MPGTLQAPRVTAPDGAVVTSPPAAVPDLSWLRASGIPAIAVPRRFGGAGGDAREVNAAVARLAVDSPSMAIIAYQHAAVVARIAEWGTREQREEYLPRLAGGEWLGASAWSEPGAGAAKQRLSSTGTRGADGRWVLDGAKSFTTGACVADLYLVLVSTSQPDALEAAGTRGARPEDHYGYGAAGQSFFLVRGDNPGLVPDLSLDLAGMRESATGFVTLRHCVVPDTDRLGPEGRAPEIIAGVRASGASLGAVSAGIAEAALDLVVAHLRRGGRLADPVVRERLTSLAARVEAIRAVVDRAGARTAADPGTATLLSKLHASVGAEEVCLEAARMLGSAGFLAGAPVNRLLADARAIAQMGPTNDLCRELVAHAWLD